MFKRILSDSRHGLVVNLGALSAALLMLALLALVGYIAVRGSGYFWPSVVYKVNYERSIGVQEQAYAQIRSNFSQNRGGWFSVSTADFPYQTQIILNTAQISQLEKAYDVAEVRLNDGRSLLATPLAIVLPQNAVGNIDDLDIHLDTVRNLDAELAALRLEHLAPIHRQLAQFDRRGVASDAPARQRILQRYETWQQQVVALEKARDEYRLTLRLIGGGDFELLLADIQMLSFPTALSFSEKLSYSAATLWQFLTEPPKQANTAGGVFPALFGTVVMVLLMTVIVAPFGVLTAIYLHEYAPANLVTSAIRVCISNMAAVPSIVYGVFGLGFLVYTVGGSIDGLFFSKGQPTPTMGTPGIFWAAVTMSLLTLPVVVVATEEGLSRVPQGQRRGSYALGATKSETIWYTVLPSASPSIMTGLILAVARAAGEVAPLILVGAVRFAPNLPIDGSFPYLHLDRQFMHLGVLIYDGAFYSQTSPKGASLMFATCSLLLLVVLVLNIVAVVLRARLRQRFQ